MLIFSEFQVWKYLVCIHFLILGNGLTWAAVLGYGLTTGKDEQTPVLE